MENKLCNASYCVIWRGFFTAVCLRLAFRCRKGTALYCVLALNKYNTLLVKKIHNAGYCVVGRWFFTAVCLRLAVSCCKGTALFDSSLYHRGKKNILKYSDNIMIYHYITGGKKKILN